jgi:hypothetical protein
VPGNHVDEDCKGGDVGYPALTSTIGFSVNGFNRYKVKHNAARLSLRSLLRGARLRPGTKVRVAITLRRTVGIQTTFTVRDHQRAPSRRDLCLVPGAKHAGRCSV